MEHAWCRCLSRVFTLSPPFSIRLLTPADPHDESHANRVAVIKPDRLWDAQPGSYAVDHCESVGDSDSGADADTVAI